MAKEKQAPSTPVEFSDFDSALKAYSDFGTRNGPYRAAPGMDSTKDSNAGGTLSDFDSALKAYGDFGIQYGPYRAVPGMESTEDSNAGGTLSDLGKSLKVGVQRLPGMVTGLADIPIAALTGARPFTKAADALGEATGFQPGKWADDTKFSAAYERGKQAVDGAWKSGGAGDIALTYLQNPGYAMNQVAESLPGMVVGGAGGRALMGLGRVASVGAKAGGVGPAMPGALTRAVGEQWATPVAAGISGGAVTAGQQMVKYKGEEQQRNALASLGAGVGTMALGVGFGRVADRILPQTVEATLGRRVGEVLSESLLKELPQSAQGQIWQNIAERKPLLEGVARAATEGAITGAVMGTASKAVGGNAIQTVRERLSGARRDQELPRAMDARAPQVAPDMRSGEGKSSTSRRVGPGSEPAEPGGGGGVASSVPQAEMPGARGLEAPDAGLVSPHWKSLDTSQYLNLLHSNTQAQRVQANDDRNYALSERRLSAGAGSRGAGRAMGREAAGAQAQGSPLQTANVPGTRDQWTPESVVQQREKVFVSEAQNAKTAQEIQAVKDRALKRGYTEEEMGRLDARFAPASTATASAESAASRAEYQRAAARHAKAEQEKQERQLYEQRKAAERRQIGDSMAEAKRVFAARIQ